MENTIFFSTRHTFRLFILFLCSISISLHGMFTAPRRTPVRKPIALPSAIYKVDPEKSQERAEALEKFKQEQLEIQRLEQKQLKKERLEAVEKQKELLQSRYPAMGFTIKGGMPALEQERIQEMKKKHAEPKVIKIQGSDGITVLFPKYVAEMSPTIKTMIEGLGGADQPLPVQSFSFPVIQDIRNIIGQDFYLPIKEAVEKKDYSLSQLIERFNFLHFLKFPSNIQDAFKNEIISRTTRMSPVEIIKNKRAIITLDSNLLEFKSVLATANTSIAIVDDEGNTMALPESFWKMSQTFSNMIGAFGGTIHEDPLPVEYPLSVVQNIRDIIEQKHSIDDVIKVDPLNKLTQITNCLNYLDLPEKITKPFYYKIYLLCKQIPEKDLPEKLSYLNEANEIFIGPVTLSLKNKIIKKFANNNDRISTLRVANLPVNVAIFSPDNKMFASGAGSESSFNLESNFLLWKVNDDGNVDKNQTPQRIEGVEDLVNCLAFSPNSRNIAIGCGGNKENNLFLCKIDSNGIINKTPQVLKGHHGLIKSVVFHPNGKMMVSTSEGSENNILLWTIESDGTVQNNPVSLPVQTLLHEYHVYKAAFSSDGTVLMCQGRSWHDELEKRGDTNTIFIWNFNSDGSLQKNIPKRHTVPTLTSIIDISFVPNSKKCILGGTSISRGKIGSSLFLCDVSNIDKIKYETINDSPQFSYFSSISPDGQMLIAANYLDPNIDLFTIQSDDTVVFNNKIVTFKKKLHVSFSPDSNKIICCSAGYSDSFRGNIRILTLLKESDKKILNDLQQLDAYQLLLIDKVHGFEDLDINKLLEHKIPKDIINLLSNIFLWK